MRGIPQQLIQNGRCYSDETGIAGINTRIKTCESTDQPQHCFDYPYVLAAGACENDMCVCVFPCAGRACCGRGRRKRSLQSLWEQDPDLHQSLPEIGDTCEYLYKYAV